jgi:glutamate formiminotransferase/formiminotetrahydrofolate cyclodeaminase
MPPLVELVPNFSEGRDPRAIAAIRDAIARTPGTAVLDVSSDASHHRTVVTFVAAVDAAVDAAFAAIGAAARVIDLTRHRGVHPRLGAADVVPFVPLADWGTTMDDAVALARALGERVGRELEIPVYLYERAALRPERANLADVRRGGFEAVRDALVAGDASRAPDFGPVRLHPTAGACIVGARPVLVAYNVYVGDASRLPVARAVARAVRASSGGLPGVKALGLEVDGQAQVSMNLVDVDATPLHVAYDAVAREAATRGAEATWSELVGLVPERALVHAGAHHVRLRGDVDSRLLERRIRAAVDASAAVTLDAFLDDLAAPSATPGGGSAAALAGALAAALAAMVAGLTRVRGAAPDAGRRVAVLADVAARGAALRARLATLVTEDVDAYAAVQAAFRAPDGPARDHALRAAAHVPLEVARAAADAAALAALLATHGAPHALSDVGTAAHLAEAACRGAAYIVRANVAALAARTASDTALVDEARACVTRAAAAAREAAEHVERALA